MEVSESFAYFLVSIVVLMIMLMGLTVTINMPGIERWSRHFFFTFFCVLSLCCCTFIADSLIYDKPELEAVEWGIVFFEHLNVSLLIPLLTIYLLHCCGQEITKSPLFYGVLLTWIFFVVMLNAALTTDRFYYVTKELQYLRGPLYALLLGPLSVGLSLDLIALIVWHKRLSRKYILGFLLCLLPMTFSFWLYTFFFLPLYIDLSIVLCAFSMFGIILSDQTERYIRQQQEIAHQRASIMVLQMRPHFIYNTMMSIYYLCDQNPKMAQQVTLDFTAYLRKNLSAIASENLIPFTEELEHTRAYLAVEQVQFEESLFVEYDTLHTQFELPPLTLQPIVENAVKHGMDPDSDPLFITIRTRETDYGSEIIVEDNGTGFGNAPDDGQHLALKNIRQRLEMMCGGQITIRPRDGGGTVVRVTIPKQSRSSQSMIPAAAGV